MIVVTIIITDTASSTGIRHERTVFPRTRRGTSKRKESHAEDTSPSVDRRFSGSQQFVEQTEVERLDQEMIESRELRKRMVSFFAVSRHGNERDLLLRETPSELLRDLIAVQAWQSDIKKDKVGAERRDSLCDGKPIKDARRGVTIEFEHPCKSSGRVAVVIHDEDAKRAFSSSAGRRDCIYFLKRWH